MGILGNIFKKKSNAKENLQEKLDRTNKLANIINSTYDFDEFLNSFEEMINSLKYLQLLEGTSLFTGSTPSKDLEEINRKRPLAEKNFIDRFISKYGKEKLKDNKKYLDKFSFETTKYIDKILKSIPEEIYYKAENSYLDEFDNYLIEAGRFLIEKDKASIGMIQRVFKIGFNRAMRIMDKLEEIGVVGEETGTKPRKILVNMSEYEKIVENYRLETAVQNIDNRSFNQERISLYNNNFDYMEGHDFEYYCADVLRKNGFRNVEVTQGSGDHGIDILAEKDDISYAIQCKCYSSDISNTAVQQAYTGKGFYHKDIAVVLTNRYFTSQAKEEAKELGVKLWDRDKLNEMIEEYT